MKKWLASVGFGIACLTCAAQAQAVAPKVESADILDLKQNQAERTRDQPGNAAPTWRIVNSGQENYSSLPYLEAGVLIQAKAQFPGQTQATSAGEAWRRFRNGPLTHFGGWILIVAALGIGALYLIKGPIKLKQGRTGRLIERFTSIERIAHWSVALSFVTLALSGLTMLFGKYVMLPLLGHGLFGWLANILKTIHNFVGPIFTLSIVVFFILYVKDNLPQAADVKWLTRLGGVIGKGHVGAERFNTGEKLWFWGGLVALGLVISASGFVLDMLVPGVAYTRANLQIAHIVHLVATVLMAAMSLGHIYIGTIGMEGAYEGMRTGYVDDAWASEHHALWYQKIQGGQIPRERTVHGAAHLGGPAKAV